VSFCANTLAENAPQRSASAAHSGKYFRKADFIAHPRDCSRKRLLSCTFDFFRFVSFTFFSLLLSSPSCPRSRGPVIHTTDSDSEIGERPGEGLRGKVGGHLVWITNRKKVIDRELALPTDSLTDF
jgi:hypothetical protein